MADMGELLGLLYIIRNGIRRGGDKVYVHCWGGRGNFILLSVQLIIYDEYIADKHFYHFTVQNEVSSNHNDVT